MDKSLLVADDNPEIVDILETYAKRDGYSVLRAYDGNAALALFHKEAPSLVLLDVMMPGKDGYAVCREIRATSNTPVILITARGEDADRIMGLDIGADDYIVKPFSPAEVMARVRAVLRRLIPPESGKTDSVRHGSLFVRLADYEATLANQPVNLTKKELEILWLFATNPGKVYTRDNLLNSIWGYDYFGDARTVDTHIKRLRSKMDAMPGMPDPAWEIRTIWGVGYKFEVSAHA
jgi:two-component system response regulator ResD